MTPILDTLLSAPVTQWLGLSLIHFLWQALAIAGVLAIVLRLLRHRSAVARYRAACIALLLMAILPLATFAFLSRDAWLTPMDEPIAPIEVVDVAPIAAVAPVPIVAIDVPPPPEPSGFLVTIKRAIPSLVAAWIAGVCVLSIFHAGGWWRAQQLKRCAVRPPDARYLAMLETLSSRLRIKRTVRLLESALVRVPIVVGWLRPAVLVPASALAGLTPQQLDAILAHELAHVKRNDYLVNLLQVVIETLLFYHPVVWWVSRRIRIERENCCDDLATALCGDKYLYVEALAAVAELCITPAAPPALAATGNNPGMLFQRIHRILTGENPAVPQRTRSLVAALTGMAVVLSLVIFSPVDADAPITNKNAETSASALIEGEGDTAGEVYIGGLITRPGAYSLSDRKITLKQLVESAGIVDLEKFHFVQLIRHNHEMNDETTYVLNLQDIFAERAKDHYLRAGDIINVLERIPIEGKPGLTGEVYVSGHVNRVGVYSLSGRAITLKQMVVSAGIVDLEKYPYAWMIRRDDRGDTQSIVYNLRDIFDGRASDHYLRGGDTIMMVEHPPEESPKNWPATTQSSKTESDARDGEYYIGGDVNRAGVYSTTGRTIRLLQALISAGVNPVHDEPLTIELRRRQATGEESITKCTLTELLNYPDRNVVVEPDDVLMVERANKPATMPASVNQRIGEMEKKIHSNRAEIVRLTQQLRDLSKEYGTDDLKSWYDATLNEMLKWRSKWMEVSVLRGLAEMHFQNGNAGPATWPAELTIEQIKDLDPQMRRLVVARDDWDMEVKRLGGKGLGDNHVQMRKTQHELQLAEDAVKKYAEEFRNQFEFMKSAPRDGEDYEFWRNTPEAQRATKTIERLRAEEKIYEETYRKAKDDFKALAEKYMQMRNLNEDIARMKEESQEYAKRIEELTAEK